MKTTNLTHPETNEEFSVEVIEERTGRVAEDNHEPTNNTYAGVGYELDENNERTGVIWHWAGNNAEGVVETATETNLDNLLAMWDGEWTDQFAAEFMLTGE